MAGLTQAVGEFIAGMRYEKVPEEARRGVVNAITDYAGCVLLGRDAEVTRIVAAMARLSKDGEARGCFSAARGAAFDAALVNGTAGHAHDYDDIGLEFHPAHPTVTIAPAVVAEAEVLGSSGQDILAAYVTGYEVWGEIASRDATPQHMKGWHPTSTFGAVAAAAACARLRGLDAKTAANAVAIAASQAGGVVSNFGTMTKPFHAGRAASAGVMSARYAAAGMTAGARAFEHEQGLIRALSPEGRVDVDGPVRFGKRWWIVEQGIGLKLYPLCYATHRAVEGIFALSGKHAITPQSIKRITMRTGPARVVPLVHHDPKTGADAKFCMEFALAAATIAGRATLAETTDEFLHRPDVQSLMKKVSLDYDPAADTGSFSEQPDDWLTVELANGEKLKQKLAPPNDRAASVQQETLWSKFSTCADGVASPKDARALFDGLQTLTHLDGLEALPVIEWPQVPSTKSRSAGTTTQARGARR